MFKFMAWMVAFSVVFGFILMMFGISMIITGVISFMEDNHWYAQTFGIIILMIGITVSVFGLLLLVIPSRRKGIFAMDEEE